MLEQKGFKLDAVISLKVERAALMERMEKRVADTLATGGTVRSDDNPDTFVRRLDEYLTNTTPLLDYYRRRGELITIDGMQEIDGVMRDIQHELSRI